MSVQTLTFWAVPILSVAVGITAMVIEICKEEVVVRIWLWIQFRWALRRLKAEAAKATEEMFASLIAAAAASEAEKMVREAVVDIVLDLRKFQVELATKIFRLHSARIKGLTKLQREQLDLEMRRLVNSVFSFLNQENRDGEEQPPDR